MQSEIEWNEKDSSETAAPFEWKQLGKKRNCVILGYNLYLNLYITEYARINIFEFFLRSKFVQYNRLYYTDLNTTSV